MLNRVFAVLASEGWLDAAPEFEKTIYLTHGAAHSMLLSRRGRPEAFVKFSDRASLQLEAQRCEAAARRFPDMAPRFIGYARRESMEVLVTRAVTFRSINPSLIRSWRHTAVIHADLETFFRHMRASAAPEVKRRQWVDDCRAYYSGHPLEARAESSLDLVLSSLSGLPPQDQHGDFVVNNLGLGRGNRLAVFDWEDYGAVDVPGLDLFTLEFSLREALGWSALPGSESLMSKRHTVLDLERMCDAMELPLQVFEDLRLGYAFIFRFLKRNYSRDIRDRVDALLGELIVGASTRGRRTGAA